MSSAQNIKLALDSFFKDMDVSVLVLKGAWGIGKTFYWNAYADGFKTNKDIKQIAYSYVSLFGINSIAEIKAKLFQNGQPIKKDNEVKAAFEKSANEEEQLANLVPQAEKVQEKNVLRSWVVRKFFQYASEIPEINKYASLLGATQYSFVKNYIICLDDIERKGDQLQMKELMGFADELSVKKGCKVVLILNDHTLDVGKDKEDFEKYREKVVDLEIEYTPTIKDNLLHIFKETESYFSQLLNTFEVLNASNIRIFKKARWAINKIEEILIRCEPDLMNEIVCHIALLCWGYYNAEKELSFQFIRKHIKDSWISVLSRVEKDKISEEMKEWDHIVTELHLSELSSDTFLIDLLERGSMDIEGFNKEIDKIIAEIKNNKAQDKLYAAWRIYSSSFSDNEPKFIAALKEVLDTDMESIAVHNFDACIQAISEFGENVDDYINRYVSMHSERLAKHVTGPDIFGRDIQNLHFRIEVEKIRESYHEVRTIDGVVRKIAEKESWNEEDINFLTGISIDDLFNWMMSTDGDVTEQIRSGLLLFDRVITQGSADKEKFVAIAAKTKEALKRVAATSPFNEKRVRNLFKIEAEKKNETIIMPAAFRDVGKNNE